MIIESKMEVEKESDIDEKFNVTLSSSVLDGTAYHTFSEYKRWHAHQAIIVLNRWFSDNIS